MTGMEKPLGLRGPGKVLVHLPWALPRESLPALLQVGNGSCAWSRVSQMCLGNVLSNSRNFALHGTQSLRLAFSPSQGPAFLAEPEAERRGADATPTVLFVSAAPFKTLQAQVCRRQSEQLHGITDVSSRHLNRMFRRTWLRKDGR